MALARCIDPVSSDGPTVEPSASLQIERTERDRLSTVLMHLFIQYPFWGSLLSQTHLLADLTLHTYGATDGLDHIWYNPLLTRTLTNRQLAFLLLHEIMHIAFQHFARQHNREHERWNHACDYAINPLARDAQSALTELQRLQHVELIPHILLDPAYDNLSAEQIYDRLPSSPTLPANATGIDEHRPFPTDADRHERLIGKILVAHQQWEQHDRRGTLPAGLLLAIDQLRGSVTPWTRILRQWGSRHLGHDEASYFPPHRRRLIRDHLIAPRTYSLRTSHFNTFEPLYPTEGV